VKLDVTGSGIRDSYIESKLNEYLSVPLNQKNLEEGLSLLRADPLIGDIISSINSTEIEGQSLLSVKARGNPPWSLGAEVSNDENPAVGSWGVRTFFENNSFLGGGERFQAEYKVTEGLERWSVGFSIPLPNTGSTVELLYQEGDSRIVDGVLKPFEVENNSYVASFRFRQTIKETLQENFAISFGVDRRSSNSSALGEELSNVELTAIRLDQSYVYKTNNILGIIISQFSLGIPDGDSSFDNTFFSWQGQGQILYNFGIGQVYGRISLQLSPDELPAIEQCAIGGRNGNQFIFGNIVRGYATNSRLGDNCAAGSLEVRFPLYRGGGFEAIAFPFVDVGYVWNNKGVSIDPQTLIGTGFGVRLSYRQALLVQANYGFALNDPDNPLEDITQGLSFSVLGRIRF
jgi:hemolysin activation/secretion protein